MSISQKTAQTNVFRLMVYRRALHPELFQLQQRRCHRQPEYEIESWLTDGGHVVRFHGGSHSVTEAVLEQGDHLPETGLVHALPCLGEKDHESEGVAGELKYVTTIQTETLSENLFAATLQEMREFAFETGALKHEWADDAGRHLSVLDAQNYKNEYHIQSYHLVGSTGFVLRTQSIFECPAGHKAPRRR